MFGGIYIRVVIVYRLLMLSHELCANTCSKNGVRDHRTGFNSSRMEEYLGKKNKETKQNSTRITDTWYKCNLKTRRKKKEWNRGVRTHQICSSTLVCPCERLAKRQYRLLPLILFYLCSQVTKLFKITVSFGSVNSLISMPGAMSHASIPAEVRLQAFGTWGAKVDRGGGSSVV